MTIITEALTGTHEFPNGYTAQVSPHGTVTIKGPEGATTASLPPLDTVGLDDDGVMRVLAAVAEHGTAGTQPAAPAPAPAGRPPRMKSPGVVLTVSVLNWHGDVTLSGFRQQRTAADFGQLVAAALVAAYPGGRVDVAVVDLDPPAVPTLHHGEAPAVAELVDVDGVPTVTTPSGGQVPAVALSTYDQCKLALTSAVVDVLAGDPADHTDHAEVCRLARAHPALFATAAVEELYRMRREHDRVCQTVTAMYEAGTGRTGLGPVRGVVEDLADVRSRLGAAEEALALSLAMPAEGLGRGFVLSAMAGVLRTYVDEYHHGPHGITQPVDYGTGIEYDAVCSGCGDAWLGDDADQGCIERVSMLAYARRLDDSVARASAAQRAAEARRAAEVPAAPSTAPVMGTEPGA